MGKHRCSARMTPPILEGPGDAPPATTLPEDCTMTVDLLPPRSPRTSSRPDGAAGRGPAAPLLRGGRHSWADVEQNCPYCAGPETD